MEKLSSVFLMDSCAFMTPSRQYYAFDFCPSFWEQVSGHIECGQIAILDMVRSEVLRGQDALHDWFDEITIPQIIRHSEPEVYKVYGKVLDYLNDSPLYHQDAVTKWSRSNVADPWLIAAAKVYQYTVVTAEVHRNIKYINPKNPIRNPGLPDVCDQFEVPCMGLFQMMRELHFKLG